MFDIPTRHVIALLFCAATVVLSSILVLAHVDLGEWQPCIVALASLPTATVPAVLLYVVFYFTGPSYSWEK
jgi:hypothetical protein